MIFRFILIFSLITAIAIATYPGGSIIDVKPKYKVGDCLRFNLKDEFDEVLQTRPLYYKVAIVGKEAYLMVVDFKYGFVDLPLNSRSVVTTKISFRDQKYYDLVDESFCTYDKDKF